MARCTSKASATPPSYTPQSLAADLDPQPTALDDTLVALAAAVAAWRHRFARHARTWTLIDAFT